jgi:hypothetical protein
MGEIVAFQAPKRRSLTPPSGGAAILFFTGVRYQRAIDEPTAPFVEADARRNRGKRKGDSAGKRRRRS